MERIGSALFAGVTGENSPLLTNQPEKIKIGHANRNIFSATCFDRKETPSQWSHFGNNSSCFEMCSTRTWACSRSRLMSRLIWCWSAPAEWPLRRESS